VVEAIKRTAVAIAEQSQSAFQYSQADVARGVLNEYNLLVQNAKIGLESDPFVQLLEEMREQGSASATAFLAGALARELEVYVGSFVIAKALRRTAAMIVWLGKRAAEYSQRPEAETALNLYNLVVRRARKLFQHDRIIGTLREVQGESSAQATAGKAARLAANLEVLLASYDKP
jgi:hypothetical protein